MNQNGKKWQSRPAIWAFDDLSHKITCFGILEEQALTLIRQKFLPEDSPQKDTLLDVGANIGNHAVFFADKFKKVVCFEPEERNFSLLKVNTSAHQNIECFNMGVSATPGFGVMINGDRTNSGKGQISEITGEQYSTHHIEICSIDTFGCLDESVIDVLKLDVEGHELQVLKGAQTSIAKDKPIILFELNAQFGIPDEENPIPLLKELGYQDFHHVSTYLDPIFDFRRKYEMFTYPVWALEVLMVILFGAPKAALKRFDPDHFTKRTYPLIIASSREHSWR
jgi:FkbM family methyltransferase